MYSIMWASASSNVFLLLLLLLKRKHVLFIRWWRWPRRGEYTNRAIAHEQILNLQKSERKFTRTPKAIRVEYSGEAVQLLFNFDVQTIMCVVYIVNEHREANKTKLTECAALNESANWDSVCLRAFFYGAILFVPISFLSLPVRQLINFFFSLLNYLLALAIDRYKMKIEQKRGSKLRHITFCRATNWWHSWCALLRINN